MIPQYFSRKQMTRSRGYRDCLTDLFFSPSWSYVPKSDIRSQYKLYTYLLCILFTHANRYYHFAIHTWFTRHTQGALIEFLDFFWGYLLSISFLYTSKALHNYKCDWLQLKKDNFLVCLTIRTFVYLQQHMYVLLSYYNQFSFQNRSKRNVIDEEHKQKLSIFHELINVFFV